MEINKTVIVASRWFLYYLTYIDDARSNTNQVYEIFSGIVTSYGCPYDSLVFLVFLCVSISWNVIFL